MAENLLLLFNSIMLGFGLAMDAFSVSLANGFADSKMIQKRRVEIAGTYALFQFAMPVIGFFLVHNASNLFLGFQKFIPWIALILLAVIGSKMLIEGCLDRKAEMKCEGNHDCGKCDRKECRKYGIDIANALVAGSINSAGVVSKFGATQGLLNFDQIKQKMDDNPNFKSIIENEK